MQQDFQITGESLPPSKFIIQEFDGPMNAQILDVLHGKSLCTVFHNYMSPEECNRLRDNFLNEDGLHQRLDGVSALSKGTDLFGQEPEAYLQAVKGDRNSVESLFSQATNVPSKLREDIQRLLPRGTAIRPALYQGVEFNLGRAAAWTDTGEFSLKYHEDKSQLSDPRQVALETARVKKPAALNCYPSVSEFGGELVIVNLAPDLRSKKRLGVEFTGYPYPDELLAGFERITLKVREGDLVALSGRFIHGVLGARGSGTRILLNHFAGYTDPKTIVMWS